MLPSLSSGPNIGEALSLKTLSATVIWDMWEERLARLGLGGRYEVLAMSLSALNCGNTWHIRSELRIRFSVALFMIADNTVVVRHHHVDGGIVQRDFDAHSRGCQFCGLFFRRHFLGAIDPFHYAAQAFSILIHHRGGAELESHVADNDLGLVRAAQIGQQIALMARIAVEEIEALADELVGAEMREHLRIFDSERLIRVSVALFM